MGSILNANIQEIYHATQASDRKVALVASWSGKQIFYAKKGWGRFWRWIYRVAEFLTGKDQRLEKLKKAMVLTQALFKKQITIVLQALHKYQTYFRNASNEYPVDENRVFGSRDILRKWNPSTAPFVRMMEESFSPRLEYLLRYCFGKDLSSQQIYDLFATPPKDLLRTCKHIVDLEGVSRGPLPLAVCKKILRGKVLNGIDNKKLDRWVKKIDSYPDSTFFAHRGIVAIAQLNKKIGNEEAENNHLNASYLEICLEDRGCKTFNQEDSRHLLWRGQLKQGQKLYVKDVEVILGKEINPSAADLDRTRVFSLVNYTDKVLLIAHNRAVLGIRQMRQRNGNPFGILPAQIEEVSEDGRIALMERLFPLDAKKWTSKEVISAEDAHALEPLIELMKSFEAKNITPSNFSPSSLMLDAKFQLRSLKPMKSTLFDFNALEDFVSQCAAGNDVVFKHVMCRSGLSNHDAAKFYYESIKGAFQGEATTAEDLGGIYRIKDPKVIDRSAGLIKEVLDLQKKVLAKARTLFPDTDPKIVNKAVMHAIYGCHKVSGAAGLLRSSLEESVLHYLKQHPPS